MRLITLAGRHSLKHIRCRLTPFLSAAALVCAGLLIIFVQFSTQAAGPQQNQNGATDDIDVLDLPGSPGRLSNSCGVPDNLTEPQTPVFDMQYPVSLPAVSLLGARNDLPNPYEPGVHWGRLPDERVWGSTAGISRAPDGTIWAIDRCGKTGAGGTTCLESSLEPVLQFDQSGKLLQSFGQGLIVSPHKITVAPNGMIWVADNGVAEDKGQQILKFSPDGELLMTLGTAGQAGSGPGMFDSPTEVAVNLDGVIYVADGHSGGGGAHGNARIVKFAQDGTFIRAWGRKGMGAGEFDVVHTIALDSTGRVYVGDRQNNRLQIFDEDGHFIDVWYQFGRPSGIHIDEHDILYVADSESRDGRTNIGRAGLPATGYGFNPGAARGIRIGHVEDGRVDYLIPDPCPYPYAGVSSLAEGVTTDADGNVYGADYLGTVRKFKNTLRTSEGR